MTFKGQVLTVDEMLREALSAPETNVVMGVGVRHTAADNAAFCRDLLGTRATLDECWRFGILQTLDDYTSTVRRGGTELGAAVFTAEPPPTGDARIDSAFAALACYLAGRDGWDPPAWTEDPSRYLGDHWYPAVPGIYRNEADEDSPPAFADRGIFITNRSLARG